MQEVEQTEDMQVVKEQGDKETLVKKETKERKDVDTLEETKDTAELANKFTLRSTEQTKQLLEEQATRDTEALQEQEQLRQETRQQALDAQKSRKSQKELQVQGIERKEQQRLALDENKERFEKDDLKATLEKDQAETLAEASQAERDEIQAISQQGGTATIQRVDEIYQTEDRQDTREVMQIRSKDLFDEKKEVEETDKRQTVEDMADLVETEWNKVRQEEGKSRGISSTEHVARH